jgi:putative redox protein
MDAKVTWKGRMSFEGSADSGFKLPLGTDLAVGGDEDGFRPIELLAIGLAGCTAMDVISVLQKKRQEVTGFEVNVAAERAADHPKVFTHVKVEYMIVGHQVDRAAVERAIELSVTKYCPAQAMLAKAVEIEHTYVIQEAPG